MTTSQGFGRDVPERAGAYAGSAAPEPSIADLVPRVGTLSVLRAAVRRRAWLWRVVAVVGLLVGLGISVERPVPYQVASTILLTPEPGAQVGEEMPNDVVMLQSRTVAERAMRDLGLGPGDSLVGTYTVKPITDRVLVLEVSAPSSSEATRRANALAAEFLKYRGQQLQAQQNLVFTSLSQQLSQAQQRVASLSGKIASVSAEPTSSAQQAELQSLETQRSQAESALTGLQQSTTAYRVTQQQATVSMIDGSQVLDTASPLKHTSSAKHAILYGGAGLVVGLVLGMGLAMVLELASDRLRRREDVARALGAPVRLSVVSVPARRGRPWRSAARGADLQRIAGHLRDSIPESPRGAAALAVVAVDNAPAAALPLVSLAVSCAQQGRQVIVADLSGGHAARLLGAGDPGVTTVTADGAQLVVAVPGRGEAAPAGPAYHVPRRRARARRGGTSRGVRRSGLPVHPGHPGSRARRGAPGHLGRRRRGDGHRRGVILGKAPQCRRDDTARRDAPGLCRPARSRPHRRKPRRHPRPQPARQRHLLAEPVLRPRSGERAIVTSTLMPSPQPTAPAATRPGSARAGTTRAG